MKLYHRIQFFCLVLHHQLREREREGERERKRENLTENTMPRGLSVEEVLGQILADSVQEEEDSPSDDDVQSPGESESAAAYRRDSFVKTHC